MTTLRGTSPERTASVNAQRRTVQQWAAVCGLSPACRTDASMAATSSGVSLASFTLPMLGINLVRTINS
jgi:hypothetical protein